MPALKKLDAVNRMLQASGEQSVNTLMNDGVNDVDLAVDILNDSTREIQSKGMNFNSEEKAFYPDSDQRIVLADTILSMTPCGPDAGRRLVQRGKWLYDADNNRFTFPNEKSVILRVTYELAFDDIPSDIQYWITDHAARAYQMQTQRNRELDQYLAERLLISQARALQYDMQNRNKVFTRNFNGNTGWGTLRNRRGFRGAR